MIKLTGIKNIVTEAKNNLGQNGLYLQVNVDKATGKVWSDLHCSIGQNSWSQYHCHNVLNCGNISNKNVTMAEVKAIVERRINGR